MVSFIWRDEIIILGICIIIIITFIYRCCGCGLLLRPIVMS